jgi:opacity protein-like surface antigen
MPDALFRPYVSAGGGIVGWESRIHQPTAGQLLRSGWNPGWTGSIGIEYYMRMHVALDVAFRYYATTPAIVADGAAARPIKFGALYIGHYVRF